MELVLQLEALMFLFGVAGARLLVLCRSLPSDVICWGPLLLASSCRMGQSSPKSPNSVENYSNRLDDCNNSERESATMAWNWFQQHNVQPRSIARCYNNRLADSGNSERK
jgi:hypothetical protein